MIDKADALRDIDQVLSEKPDYGGDGAVAQVKTRLYACVCRHAPPGTAYRKQADVAFDLLPGGRPHPDAILRGVLEALRADVAADRVGTFEELVHADLFTDLLAQAEHLAAEGFTRAACVLAGGTLEEQLRRLATKNGIPLKGGGEPPKASALNNSLYTSPVNAYSKAEHAQVDAWLKVRNEAAHGQPDFEVNHSVGDMKRMCDGIREFVVRHPA